MPTTITVNTRTISYYARISISLIIVILLVLLYCFWPWRNFEHNPSLSWLSYWALFEFRYKIIGSFLLIPILYSVFYFWWRGTMIIWLISVLGILPKIIVWELAINAVINIGFLLFPLLIAGLISFEIKWRLNQRIIFLEREKERKLYTAKVIEAQERERQRIALELHDNTIQSLIAVVNQLASISVQNSIISKELKTIGLGILNAIDIARKNKDTKVMRHLSKINQKISSVIPNYNKNSEGISISKEAILTIAGELRELSLNLRPIVLDKLGLLSSIRWLADRINKTTQIDISVSSVGEEHKFSPQTETSLFRVVQEVLNNIKYHSKASKANIDVIYTDRDLQIRVDDNGRGFDMPENILDFVPMNKLGIIGMHERIKILNGTCEFSSKKYGGTSILFKIGY